MGTHELFTQVPTSDVVGLDSALSGKADAAATTSALALKAPLASPAFTGTPTGITKSHVGLGSVDNTADTAKPVSSAQQTALDGKQANRAATRTVTASETLTSADYNRTVLVDSASTVTLTLPTAVGASGSRLAIVKIGTGLLILDANGSQTIMGQLTESISMQWGTRTLESDGAGWVAVSGKVDPIITTFADVAGAGSISLNAAAATIYRGRVTGTTATLAAPSNPIDGDRVDVEIFNSNAAACALTIGSGINVYAGTTSPISIPAGKLLVLSLRYRGTTSPATVTAGWHLVADRLMS